ncbi:MAG: hypothetical protein Q9M15_06530 [Mariprofundaceae bacterium]|nr:hypothetical protein [Mariprofundaceae bacterium]
MFAYTSFIAPLLILIGAVFSYRQQQNKQQNKQKKLTHHLQQTQKAYDTSLNRMTSGTGNVMRQMDQLGTIAGKTNKTAHTFTWRSLCG